jgi:GT2 family glycosyltransferase
MNATQISLVIVLYGKRAVTEMGLASLQQVLGDRLGDEIELVLVDNASPDDTGELLDAWEDRATVVRNPRNLNFAGGCNVGARAASAPMLVFLNNDMEFVPGTIEAVAATAAEPEVGIAGARLLFPDGTIQHAGVIWGANEVGPAMPHHVLHHEAGDMAAARAVLDLDGVTGACLAIRRELFLELGGFDEAYLNGLEDIDLCLRVRSRGLRIVYRGDVCLIHHESVTRGIDLEQAAHNDAVFQARWGEVTGPDDELAREAYGGSLTVAGRIVHVFPDWNDGGDIAVEGHLRSIAPEAAEARALLLTLESAGLMPRAREWVPARLVADLTDNERAHLDVVTKRWRSPRALKVEVVSGQLYDVRRRHADIIRIARPPTGRDHLEGVTAVWTATERLATELIADGVDESRVATLPPPVLPPPPGQGGGGLLVVLPGHDLATCASILSALANRSAVILLPNVLTPRLAALAAELAPGAQLRAPITSELRFAELAGQVDGVLCLDPADEFGRRALIAAAAGTAVAGAIEAAEQVLGTELILPEADLTRTIDALRERATDRQARRRLVLSRCDPSVLAPRAVELVTQARRVGQSVLSRLAPTASATR